MTATGQYPLALVNSARTEASQPWLGKLVVGTAAGLALLASLALVWEAAKYMGQDLRVDSADLSLVPYLPMLGCLLSAAALAWALNLRTQFRLTLGTADGEQVGYQSTDGALAHWGLNLQDFSRNRE